VQHHHQATINYHHHYHQCFHHQSVPQDKGVAKVINASCGVNQLGPWARFACVAQQKAKKTSSFPFPFALVFWAKNNRKRVPSKSNRRPKDY